MKRIYFMGIILCLLLVVAACNRCDSSTVESHLTYHTPTAPNQLLQLASAENSAFEFFIFDGETVTNKFVFQSASHRQEILDGFINTPAARVTGWMLDDITLPVYGMRLGTVNGPSIWVAWSNGFWITQTGDVYRFDFDFATLVEQQPWELQRENNQFAWFPNAIFLTRDENGWHNKFLAPAAPLNPPNGIQMTLVSQIDQDVTFTLTNNNNADWYFGVRHRFDMLLDGNWYTVPPLPGDWGFISIGLILKAGQTITYTYDWQMHGDLPPGTYRLVKFDMYVVFEI